MSTTLTFTTLSQLHEHLRGGVIVRLLNPSSPLSLIFIPAGHSAQMTRKVIAWTIKNLDGSESVQATSEPTEFSQWF